MCLPMPSRHQSANVVWTTRSTRQNLGNIGEKQGVRRQDHHVFRLQCVSAGIKQVGDPMQGDGGFTASGCALDQQIGIQGMTDHNVLFRLDGGDDFPQAVCGNAPQHSLQVCFLGDDPAVKEADQLPVLYRQHPLQGQVACYMPVRGFVIHLPDLAGVIQVCNGGAPVHDHRRQRHRIQHAPAAQIPGFRSLPGGGKVQPGEVCLAGGHGQLPQPVQLIAEALDGHLLLFIRIFLHPDVHDSACLCPGQFFHLGNFPVNGIAGLLKVLKLFPGGGMVRQFQ